MPESIPDYSHNIARAERRLKRINRDISKVTAVSREALENDNAISRLKTALVNAQNDWKSFREVYDERDEMLLLTGVEENFVDEWAALYDATYQIISDAETILSDIQARLQGQTGRNMAQTTPPPALNIQNHNPLNETQVVNVRSHLPVIQIPQFNGDLTQWNHFKDTFKSLVHEEPSLSNVEKFHYLISSLKGNAATLVSKFQVDDRSYPLAWDKLIKEYANPRVLGSLYLQRILESSTKSMKNETRRYEAYLTNIGDSLDGFRSLALENKEEFILASLALRDLDPDTRKAFELSIRGNQNLPKADDVVDFVRQRLSAMKLSRDFSFSSSQSNDSQSHRYNSTFRKTPPDRFSPRYSVSLHTSSGSRKVQHASSDKHNRRSPLRSPSPRRFATTCPFCQGDHHLAKCKGFTNISCVKRAAFVEGWKGCKNCLRDEHTTSKCPSNFTCRHCSERHHTLIHVWDKSPSRCPSPKVSANTPAGTSNRPSVSFTGFGSTPQYVPEGASAVLLGTIQAQAKGSNGSLHTIRAILDCGSEHTFISKALAVKLDFPVQPFNRRVTGLGGVPTTKSLGTLPVTIRSLRVDQEVSTDAIIVDSISPRLPSQDINPSIFKSLSNLELADASFGRSGTIDALIGADLYPLVVTGGPSPSKVPGLSFIPTIFGLAIMGRIQQQEATESSAFFILSSTEIEEQLARFWEIEEPEPANRTNPHDAICEEHFVHTHSRTSDGRYVVKLPFKTGTSDVGNNRQMVTRRLYSLENKLRRDPTLNAKYVEFLDEYHKLGHMEAASSPSPYLIPHHGVWQESTQGRKLRVVFDASCSSSTTSLNELLYSGPKLQNDIADILVRFRTYQVPLCGDLVKMYRQILIHPEDRGFQHIIWRSSAVEPVTEYELNTVTYGIKSSAFQALRVIKQLLKDEGSNFPLAAQRVSTDMYVDDIVSGADSIEEAKRLQEELIALFGRGGFQLGKWASTLPSLAPDALESLNTVNMQPSDDHFQKILGLCWNPKTDSFVYITRNPPSNDVTKRAMLSTIARIFDPLGLLSPITFKAKTLLQDVWKAKLNWDDFISGELADNWKALIAQWKSIAQIQIPRLACGRSASCRLVGFCDASLRGYAAAVYLRAEDADGRVKVTLIKAKGKVSPLKYMSIARLELCGALLLSRVISSVHIPRLAHDTFCFTDSQVVLSWLQSPQYMLKVFEANRVASILQRVPLHSWRHVRSEDNPADLSSRGCTPLDLKDNMLWWHGPFWLELPVDRWPGPPETQIFAGKVVVCPEEHQETIPTTMAALTSRLASYTSVVRTLGYVLRFIRRCRTKIPIADLCLSAEEYNAAELICFRLIQKEHLDKEMLQQGGKAPKSLEPLSPFIDEDGIVRVGGRLNYAPLDYSSKHPILIPPQSPLAKLIIRETHEKHFHAGPNLTLVLTRGRFWIPRSRRLIRSCINHCIQCRIRRAKPLHPPMAPLPAERFISGKAFTQVGVDYAGPFCIKESHRRKAPISKAYLCLFVCFATKALHLELVSTLTTAGFLACLDRFIARRGVPQVIWSDHGTNFIGAARYLKDLYAFLKSNHEAINRNLSSRCTAWKLIPPRAPHFGGLWEAGVKSVKRLLTGATGKQTLTFEEMTTLLTRIEGVLNSRPLCALTEDPEDFDYLTPGHFLIGSSSLALPETPDATPGSNVALLTRWRSVQESTRALWERWRKEYLNSLQQRMKWNKNVPPLQVGDLVILLEKRSNIGVWPVARVLETFPGRDGFVRSVTVRTPSGNELTRAVASLVPLFFPHEKETKNISS